MNPLTEKIASLTEGASGDAFEIAIANEQSHLVVDLDWLSDIVRSVLSEEGVQSAQISIALVADEAIHLVNRRFLGHDSPTDVISFLLNEPAEESQPRISESGPMLSMEGEIVISTETARRSANELGCPPADELALYLVHGLLHLCGYDDHSTADREQMRQREQSHLKKCGIHAHYEV